MARRKTNPEDIVVLSIRPHQDLRGDFERIIEWCNNHDQTFNSIINSLLPALAYSLELATYVDEKTGQRYIRADWGDLPLRTSYYSDFRFHGLDDVQDPGAGGSHPRR